MEKIAKFEKVSFEEFKGKFTDLCIHHKIPQFADDQLTQVYESIQLPERSTTGSAGYDFKSCFGFMLNPGMTMTIPTGIRVKINDGWMLTMVPRSSLGCKYRIQLDNTIGIIDSDYYYSDNEGHIMIKLTNDSKVDYNMLKINPGDKFVQGIFIPYGITIDDNATGIRNGGFGSTDNKEVTD